MCKVSELSSSFHHSLQTKQNWYTPRKTNMTIENHGKLTIWRCISYSKWWFSMAMLVFRGGGGRRVKLKRNTSKRNTNQSSTALMSWHFSLVHWFLQSPKVTWFLFPSRRFCWAHVILMLRHGASPREIWGKTKSHAVGNAATSHLNDLIGPEGRKLSNVE